MRYRYINECVSAGILAVSLGLPTIADAAAISWGSAQNITGNNSDVVTNGTLVSAYAFGNSSATVNGVTFDLFSENSNDGGNTYTNGSTTLTNMPDYGNWDSSTGGDAAYTTVSNNNPSYATVLGGCNCSNGGPQTSSLTLGGLTYGQTYEFQVWLQDPRGSIRSEIVGDTPGSGVTLYFDPTFSSTYQSGNATTGLGQYAIGTFTADLTGSETVYFYEDNTDSGDANGGGATQINAYQLRAVPEPASIGLFGAIGSLAILRRVRRGRTVVG